MTSSIVKRTAIVRRFNLRGKVLPALAGGMSLTFAAIGHAFAQAAAPAGGLGAQMNTMSSEGINAAGNAVRHGLLPRRRDLLRLRRLGAVAEPSAAEP